MKIDFTIESNGGIKKFLEGDDTCIPVHELIYLHTRPLIRPNFLTEINDLVENVGKKIISRNVTGKPVADLISIAINIGKSIETPSLTEPQATTILLELRKLYSLCNHLDKSL